MSSEFGLFSSKKKKTSKSSSSTSATTGSGEFPSSLYASDVVQVKFESGPALLVHSSLLFAYPALSSLYLATPDPSTRYRVVPSAYYSEQPTLPPFLLMREISISTSYRAGHALVHYLYTGSYKPLERLGLPVETTGTNERLKECLEIYVVARRYGIHDLEDLIKNELVCQAEGTDPSDMAHLVQDAQGIYPELIGLDRWFPVFIKDRFKAFMKQTSGLDLCPISSHLGEGDSMTTVLMAGIFDAYREIVAELRKPAAVEEPVTTNAAKPVGDATSGCEGTTAGAPASRRESVYELAPEIDAAASDPPAADVAPVQSTKETPATPTIAKGEEEATADVRAEQAPAVAEPAAEPESTLGSVAEPQPEPAIEAPLNIARIQIPEPIVEVEPVAEPTEADVGVRKIKKGKKVKKKNAAAIRDPEPTSEIESTSKPEPEPAVGPVPDMDYPPVDEPANDIGPAYEPQPDEPPPDDIFPAPAHRLELDYDPEPEPEPEPLCDPWGTLSATKSKKKKGDKKKKKGKAAVSTEEQVIMAPEPEPEPILATVDEPAFKVPEDPVPCPEEVVPEPTSPMPSEDWGLPLFTSKTKKKPASWGSWTDGEPVVDEDDKRKW